MSDTREPPTAAARPASFWRKTFLDPVLLVLVALSVGLAVWGVWRVATDPNDESGILTFLLMGTPTIPTAWSVLRVIWSEDASVAIVVALFRTLLVPIVVPWPPAIAATIALYTPTVRELFESTRGDWRYFFNSDDGSLLTQSLWMGGLIGMIFGLLLGLVLSVFIVLPILAWFKPLGAAKSNMLLTETKEDQRAAKSGIRMLSVILVMTFGVPALIIYGREEGYSHSWIEAFANLPMYLQDPLDHVADFARVIGILTIPFGIWLIIWLKRTQRPDIAKRAEYGVNALDDRIRWQLQQRAQAEEESKAAGGVEAPAQGDPSTPVDPGAPPAEGSPQS